MLRHLELTLDRRRRFQLLLDAIQTGGKAGGDGQVGVGVGTWQTVLNPPCHRRTGRNAQAGSAIVF
ncbi:hypothetical protein D3C76_1318960 [compost metagenome]